MDTRSQKYFYFISMCWMIQQPIKFSHSIHQLLLPPIQSTEIVNELTFTNTHKMVTESETYSRFFNTYYFM